MWSWAPGARARRSRTRCRTRGSAPRARASPAAPPAGAGSPRGSGGTPPSARPPPARARRRRHGAAVEDERAQAERCVRDEARADARRAGRPSSAGRRAASRARRGTRALHRPTANSTTATTSGIAPGRAEPRTPIGLGGDGVLERREAAVHRLALVLDLVAEARERSLPPSSTLSTTSATSRSQARSSPSSPAEISRSEIVSLRRPPQIDRSVVVGSAL